MREVYVYDEFCEDFDNLGLVGALTPTSCEHEEIAGGMSEVVLVHPIDETGKYKALEKGRILKCIVPVRTTPEIDGTQVVGTVWKYHVKSTSSKEQRKVWSKREEGKKLGSLKANQEVVVVKRNDSWSRYKIKANKLNGWVDKAALQEDASVVLPENDPTAIEDIYPLWGDKEQLFRIYAEDRSDAEITVHARHISYDLLTNMTMYKNTGEVSLLDAANGVFTQCVDSHDFTVQTNIADTKVGVDYRHNNPINALFDPEVGILKKWDVQLVRDDYELTILKTVGRNRGMSVEYGRNLTGVTCTIDTSNVVTCVLPTGVDHDGKPLYLTDDLLVNGLPNPNNYVFAKQSIRDMYPFEHVYHLECEDATEGSEEADDKKKTYKPTKAKVRERMLEQAREVLWADKDHYTENDQPSANTMPTVSLQVEFVTLGDTEEYRQFKDLERLFLYDKVRVRVPKLNIDMLLDAVRVKTDCLTGHTVEVEIGAVTDIEVSVPSWAITSLNGGKIVAGSIPAGSFGPGVITADAIFSNAITTHHLAADSVVADKIMAHTITADKLSAEVGEFTDLVVDNLNVDDLTADEVYARFGNIDELVSKLIQVDSLQAQSAVVGELQANYAHMTQGVIDNAQIDYASVKDLNANYAHISNGKIDNAEIDVAKIDNLSASVATISNGYINNAMITQAKVENLSTDFAHITNGKIDNADIDVAKIVNLSTKVATIENGRINNASIDTADINNLSAAVISAVAADLGSADIDYLKSINLNSTMATIADGKIALLTARNIKIEDTLSAPYIIGDDGYFTGKINAGSIDAGEINAGLLKIRGEDGLFYKINVAANSAHEITAEEWDADEAKDHLYGASIMDGTLEAVKIKAESITADQIKSGTIDTTKVTDGFGAGLILESNVSITSLVGRANALEADLDEASETSKISVINQRIDEISATVADDTRITTLEHTADGFAASITDLSNKQEASGKWMKFTSDGLTISDSENAAGFAVNIDSEKMSFMQGTAELAYVKNNAFRINEGEIEHTLRIGNFVFKPQNGGMSLVHA